MYTVQKDPINPTYYDELFDKLLESKFTTEDLIKIDEFNVLKYVYRWRNKNGIQDLKKARWYLDSMITKLEVEEAKKDADEILREILKTKSYKYRK